MTRRRKNLQGAAIKPKNYHALQFLESATPKLRRIVIKNSDTGIIDALSECCKNVLIRKNTKVTKALKKMRPYRFDIRKIADKQTPIGKRRKLLVQRGGFLQYLLPLALSTLTSIFAPKH
jgi:hypothetical protein